MTRPTATILIAGCLLVGLVGCSTARGTSATPSSADPSSSAANLAARPGHHELADILPKTVGSLSYDASQPSGLNSTYDKEVALESWGGVVGCNSGFIPLVAEYLPAEYKDSHTGRVGQDGLDLFRLTDATGAQAAFDACNSSAEYAASPVTTAGQSYHTVQTSTGPSTAAIVGDVLIVGTSDSSTVDSLRGVIERAVANAAS